VGLEHLQTPNLHALHYTVIEFLVKEIFATDIHHRFQCLYEMCAWALVVLDDGLSILKMGTRASDQPRSGRPRIASTEPNKVCILIEFLEPQKTINASHYTQTLSKLNHALRDKCPGRKFILQHDTLALTLLV
jgi:hypothetical protein